jgi:hypothetical protein
MLDPRALVNGRRTFHRALSRRPCRLHPAELPEALRLDHPQESVRASAGRERWPEYLETSGRLLHLGMVLGKKISRHGNRYGRVIASTLLKFERPPKVIERIAIISK